MLVARDADAHVDIFERRFSWGFEQTTIWAEKLYKHHSSQPSVASIQPTCYVRIDHNTSIVFGVTDSIGRMCVFERVR